eukprot:TRINITY_DN18768_c0_g1_i1.p1 TRINITY_DN18768_c0_g1~~TRINITY_DN18768_c0_g1_i1.p1  ORF type:complete len:223 (-),score=59.61 TRINITY_DN18768_c0_g1_i1:907-1575(-)
MEALFRRFMQLYSRAQALVDDWLRQRTTLLAQLDTVAAIIGRLPVLDDEAANYGVLRRFAVPGASKEGAAAEANARRQEGPLPGGLLLGHQLLSLEAALNGILTTLASLESGVCQGLERAALDGARALESAHPRPTAEQLSARWGVQPSLEEGREGLRSLAQMHRQEWRLKSAVLRGLLPTTRPEDLEWRRRLIAEEPNIARNEVHEIFLRMAWREAGKDQR